MKSTRQGFTLIELLMLTAMIGVLIGLFRLAVQLARQAARHIECVNILKQLGTTASHAAYLFEAWGTDRAKLSLRDLAANEIRLLPGNK
jgi:type II secretory pathway pseudopilin PulG